MQYYIITRTVGKQIMSKNVYYHIIMSQEYTVLDDTQYNMIM